MTGTSNETLLFKYWTALYSDIPSSKLGEFLSSLTPCNESENVNSTPLDWYKDAVVYSLYVDLFSVDFQGLINKLDYLSSLGVSCLWLLPVLDSPMRDAGFDIRNYDKIRPDLFNIAENSTNEDYAEQFKLFLDEAHMREINVIFDIAINHSSDEHPWFIEARKSEDNPYRDYYIWSKDTKLYGDARIIFKGIEESNWEPDTDGWNYFHRFFSFQPDLNYRNPEVLFAMCKNLLYWQKQGVDGFRADAIPYLWKEDGTSCENLEKTHIIVKFFRAVLDYVKPGSLLLAEACMKPETVVEYLGDGDECHAVYHFPLMPMIFKSIAAEDGSPIKETLSPEVTPKIPDEAQWFTFLRVHDELSLELVYVSEEDRKFIHDNYCHEPEWDFRVGEGISARLSELMQRNVGKIGLAFSLMLTLTGTPVVYYGDEFGKLNDDEYYREQIKLTGKDDTRFLVRGRINWHKLEEDLKVQDGYHSSVFSMTSGMLSARSSMKVFGRGTTTFLDSPKKLLVYTRETETEKVLVVNNLSMEKVSYQSNIDLSGLKLLYAHGYNGDQTSMNFLPHGFAWFTSKPKQLFWNNLRTIFQGIRK